MTEKPDRARQRGRGVPDANEVEGDRQPPHHVDDTWKTANTTLVIALSLLIGSVLLVWRLAA